jgi:hypothetical protein
MIPRLQTERIAGHATCSPFVQTFNEAVQGSVSFVINNMKGGQHAAW